MKRSRFAINLDSRSVRFARAEGIAGTARLLQVACAGILLRNSAALQVWQIHSLVVTQGGTQRRRLAAHVAFL